MSFQRALVSRRPHDLTLEMCNGDLWSIMLWEVMVIIGTQSHSSLMFTLSDKFGLVCGNVIHNRWLMCAFEKLIMLGY